ncbi:hypothetical protein [Calothrix sp. UHCC 0171]|uniref:hypothetical protein n=1 Tax=Calothrix sp. UHCC 0171 TaxID=3110245 RepID=UPI002B1F18C2|nr:hypothetical protein [Calothrix sp. UHCC 0171]MEA5572846.1 hypothetical protein [Calothrix sp. UHCC 0171]
MSFTLTVKLLLNTIIACLRSLVGNDKPWDCFLLCGKTKSEHRNDSLIFVVLDVRSLFFEEAVRNCDRLCF